MADDLTPQIASDAATPASFSEEGRTDSKRSLTELIAADKYLKQTQAASNPTFGIRFSKIVPPGPICDYGETKLQTPPFDGGV